MPKSPSSLSPLEETILFAVVLIGFGMLIGTAIATCGFSALPSLCIFLAYVGGGGAIGASLGLIVIIGDYFNLKKE
jgi:hypothetical protein